MLNTYSEIKKRGKIKLYAKKLPYTLKKYFGKKDLYNQMQVDQALSENFVDIKKHNDYSYAMFCTQDEFDRIQASQGTDLEYNNLRGEIADICFKRQVEFTVNDIMEYASGDWGGDFDYRELGDYEADVAV